MKPMQHLIMLAILVATAPTMAAEPSTAAPAAADKVEPKTGKTAAQAPAEAADTRPADAKAADAKTADGKSEADAASKTGDKETKASPQRFVPSEQVRADFDVSFPIDI